METLIDMAKIFMVIMATGLVLITVLNLLYWLLDKMDK